MPTGSTKISIVVAAYNAQDLIQRCIDSCLVQTYDNFEVIVVDDGSTDATADILDAYARDDARVQCLHIENGGQGRARNIALDHVTGTYVTILDADDALHECALERLVDASQDGAIDIVTAEWVTIDEVKRAKRYAPIFTESDRKKDLTHLKSRLIRNTYFSVAKLYRRDLLEARKIRYGEGYIYEDMEFLLGAVLTASSISFVLQPLYFVYAGEETSTKANTDSTWHADSFTSAVKVTTRKYGTELAPFRKYYAHYILNRTYFYTKKRNRIPRKMWKEFTNNIFHYLNTLYDQPPNRSTISLRYYLPMRAWRVNSQLGYAVFQILSGLMNVSYFRSLFSWAKRLKKKVLTSQTVRGMQKTWRQKQKRRLMRRVEAEDFDDNSVFLHGFDGKFKGNTKYVIPDLLAQGFHVVLPLKSDVLPQHDGLTIVEPWSLDHHYWHKKSRFHLLETWRANKVGKRESSVWIQMWHGTPFKRLLFDSDERDVVNKAPAHKLNKMRDITGWDYLLAQNEFAKEKLSSAFSFNKNNILVGQYPRTDIFQEDDQEKYKKLIRKKYNVPVDKKILLYTTTWRDYNQYTPQQDFSYQLDMKEISPLLDEYFVLCCLHPFGKDFAPTGVVVTEGDDFQHLMIAADAMITDYSSAAFDFMLLDKPFCFFAKDLEKFSKSRGVYTEILTDFASLIAFTEKEVVHIMQNWHGLDVIRNKDRYLLAPYQSGGAHVAAFMHGLKDDILEQKKP